MNFLKKFGSKTLNQMIARWAIGRFDLEDLNDEKLKVAINYWCDNL